MGLAHIMGTLYEATKTDGQSTHSVTWADFSGVDPVNKYESQRTTIL